MPKRNRVGMHLDIPRHKNVRDYSDDPSPKFKGKSKAITIITASADEAETAAFLEAQLSDDDRWLREADRLLQEIDACPAAKTLPEEDILDSYADEGIVMYPDHTPIAALLHELRLEEQFGPDDRKMREMTELAGIYSVLEFSPDFDGMAVMTIGEYARYEFASIR